MVAYRMAVQDLDRRRADAVDCAVLDLGVLDRPPGRSARAALHARSVPGPGRPGIVTVHSIRGEIRLHRAADLALYLAAVRTDQEPATVDGLAAAMRAVTADGTPRTRDELAAAVPACDDTTFRYATSRAGLRIDTTPPRKKTPRYWYVPLESDPGPLPDPAEARHEVVRRFLRLRGAVTDRDLATWLGVPEPTARALLAGQDVIPVDVAGRPVFVHAGDLDAVRDAPPPTATRLLAPHDPLTELAGMPRDPSHPGTLLIRGAVAGGIRLKLCKDDITVGVLAHTDLSPADRAAISAEAAIVAEHLGVPAARVRYDDAPVRTAPEPARPATVDERRRDGRAALLIVDMQVGVVDRCVDRDGVLARTGLLVERARAAGTPVVYVLHEEPGMERGSDSWRLAMSLTGGEGDSLVSKRYPDSFADTTLEATLARLGVSRLVIAGARSDHCVITTARRAAADGYDVTLVSDCHTTWDTEHDGVRISGEQQIAQTNRHVSGLHYPGRSCTVEPHARVSFVGL